ESHHSRANSRRGLLAGSRLPRTARAQRSAPGAHSDHRQHPAGGFLLAAVGIEVLSVAFGTKSRAEDLALRKAHRQELAPRSLSEVHAAVVGIEAAHQGVAPGHNLLRQHGERQVRWVGTAELARLHKLA